MYRTATRDEVAAMAQQSAALLSDQERFRSAAERVTTEWGTASAVNMTRDGNRLAWIGQAACCIDHGATEVAVRVGWSMMAETDRQNANRTASEVADIWESRDRNNPCRSGQLELTF